jgi:precorrin-6A/cobalt-precorrin-6A reductase
MIWILGGTGEGAAVTRRLDQMGYPVFSSTSTPWGATMLATGTTVPGTRQPLNPEQMDTIVKEKGITLIIDATHPFATRITKQAQEIAGKHGIPYMRFERPPFDPAGYPPGTVTVTDPADAARILCQYRGNILLTIGIRSLHHFKIPPLQSRLYVRILPVPSSVQEALEQGIPPQRIIAVKSPLSVEMNAAIMKEYQIETMVTKESGEAGGLTEKIEAARRLNIKVLVIQRPQMTYPRQVNTISQLEEWIEINFKNQKSILKEKRK